MSVISTVDVIHQISILHAFYLNIHTPNGLLVIDIIFTYWNPAMLWLPQLLTLVGETLCIILWTTEVETPMTTFFWIPNLEY